MHDAVRHDQDISQRHDAQGDQHQDQHCPADLDRDFDAALLSADAGSTVRPIWRMR